VPQSALFELDWDWRRSMHRRLIPEPSARDHEFDSRPAARVHRELPQSQAIQPSKPSSEQ
jgi:hypothetical protein